MLNWPVLIGKDYITFSTADFFGMLGIYIYRGVAESM